VDVALGVAEPVSEAGADVVPPLLGSLPVLQPESARAAVATIERVAMRNRRDVKKLCDVMDS
jgi:hypothetical protein